MYFFCLFFCFLSEGWVGRWFKVVIPNTILIVSCKCLSNHNYDLDRVGPGRGAFPCWIPRPHFVTFFFWKFTQLNKTKAGWMGGSDVLVHILWIFQFRIHPYNYAQQTLKTWILKGNHFVNELQSETMSLEQKTPKWNIFVEKLIPKLFWNC